MLLADICLDEQNHKNINQEIYESIRWDMLEESVGKNIINGVEKALKYLSETRIDIVKLQGLEKSDDKIAVTSAKGIYEAIEFNEYDSSTYKEIKFNNKREFDEYIYDKKKKEGFKEIGRKENLKALLPILLGVAGAGIMAYSTTVLLWPIVTSVYGLLSGVVSSSATSAAGGATLSAASTIAKGVATVGSFIGNGLASIYGIPVIGTIVNIVAGWFVFKFSLSTVEATISDGNDKEINYGPEWK